MRFNLGEVWKSVEAGGGEPRRAVVVAIEDEGRSGRLFFDNGDEQSFLWAELTQAGRWQVDTSPKPTRRADELKEMILRQIQRHPVCPAGMSVEIRSRPQVRCAHSMDCASRPWKREREPPSTG